MAWQKSICDKLCKEIDVPMSLKGEVCVGWKVYKGILVAGGEV